MPKNNGKARKLQRQVNADAIRVQSERYACGHKHINQEQYIKCPTGMFVGANRHG